jgi:hypothetical protein
MKKRVVRLDQRQLRGIIKEAIQTREPGSPLWSPEPEKRVVKESNLANDLPAMLADMVQGSWEELYDDADPSMQHAGGKQAWDQQVADAAEEFATRVNQLLEEIETKLVQGEFYFEDPGYPGGHR